MMNTSTAFKGNNWAHSIAAQMPSRDDQNSLARDILKTIEDALNNRGGGELDMIANIARRIGNIAGFSGLSFFAQHAVMLNAERQSNNPAIAGIENFWERLKEKIKEDEKVAFNNADFASDVQQAAQQTEQAREARWDNSTHNFAGMEMTGQEIDDLTTFMKDPSNRQRLIAKRAQANGGDVTKATKEVDNAILYAELYKKIEKGTATPAERAKFEELDKTSGVRETVRLVNQEQENALSQNADAKAGNVQNSSIAFTNTLDSNPFPTAPNLRAHHAAALAATSPLEEKPKLAMASNDVTPPVAVKVDSGFAV